MIPNWPKWGETMKQISDKDCLIWGTDNNGQVEIRKKVKKGGHMSLGKWDISNLTERRNGANWLGNVTKRT